ncbi:MAG: sterol desaturase family protein [Pseudomonadota bacterium]
MELLQDNLVAWKGALVLGWLALLFAAERLAPAARPPVSPPDAPAGGLWRVARNLGLLLLNAGLSPLIVLPLSLWAASHHLGWRPEWWSGWTGLALDILLLDFLIYWWHLANHKVALLWRFHEVHHLDRFLDSTTALRFHFGEVLLSAVARAAMVITLDIPFSSIVVFEVLLAAGTIFHHSNLRLPPRLEAAMSRLVITPSIHWVHHHARQADTDSNYGTLFSFWDRLFGSRSPTPRSLDMTIGVEQRPERRFLQLLARPFWGER